MSGIQGQIDSSFTTEQRDLFASGLVAEIGVNAYAVWHAIKYFADYGDGTAHPGMRKLGEKLGLGKSTIQRAVEVLIEAKMLRVVKASIPHRRGQTYIARERMAVRVGNAVLCTIVLDYVPERFRGQLKRLGKALDGGNDPEIWAEVEIIPGAGFEWDPTTKTLRGKISARTLPPASTEADDYHKKIGEAILAKVLPKK